MLAMAAVGISGSAQVLDDGFYRVQNTRSLRYCLLADDYAYVDESASGAGTGSVYLQAIRTYRPFDRIVSEPGSVIKFTYSNSGKGYTLAAQGTDTYTMLKKHGNYYLTLRKNGKVYTASATAKGFTIHLSDESLDTEGQYTERWDTLGFMQPTGDKYQYWYITKVDANTDNYFGFRPTITIGDKNYQSFYAGFSFKKHSDGIHAYYVDSVRERAGVARLREITTDVLPASVPMIIETAYTEPSLNKVDIVDGNGTAPAGNKLTGVYFCSVKELLPWYDQPGPNHNDVYTLNDSNTMRLLGVDNGQLVLKKANAKYVPANSFYLKVSSKCPDVLKLVDAQAFADAEDIVPTGITSVSTNTKEKSGVVYNLNGQRVSTTGIDNLPKGIYILDGKKIMKN